MKRKIFISILYGTMIFVISAILNLLVQNPFFNWFGTCLGVSIGCSITLFLIYDIIYKFGYTDGYENGQNDTNKRWTRRSMMKTFD